MVAVVPGRAWVDEDDVVPFDDPAALWKQVHATVAVEEVLGASDGVVPPEEEVLVAFTLDGDEDEAMAQHQLVNDQLLVLPLLQWEGTDYLPDLWSVGPGNASMVAEVDDDGELLLPCVSERNSDRLLTGLESLEALREAARRPERVIRKEPVGYG